jgi:hypothetical protein
MKIIKGYNKQELQDLVKKHNSLVEPEFSLWFGLV